MKDLLRAEHQFLRKPLNLRSRLMLVVAAICVIGAVFSPLWKMTLRAPQYEEGLELFIYAWKIEGGGLNGNDLAEINKLNHYIGMKPIEQADFAEMQVMPFMFGAFILLALRAAVFGVMGAVVDLFMLASYFGLFSIGAFWYRLFSYGHNLDPMAPMDIEPFTPLLLGTQKIANFTQSSYPQWGTYLLWIFMVLLAVSLWLSRKEAAPS